MSLSDKIDVDNESEEIKKRRIENLTHATQLSGKRKGFCNNCLIY